MTAAKKSTYRCWSSYDYEHEPEETESGARAYKAVTAQDAALQAGKDIINEVDGCSDTDYVICVRGG